MTMLSTGKVVGGTVEGQKYGLNLPNHLGTPFVWSEW